MSSGILKYALNHDGLICQFCGKECKNRNSLCNHERLCKENPNRQVYEKVGFNNVGRVAWNKGLTKETDTRVAKNSKAVSLALAGKPGHSASSETREKISNSMKIAHAEGRAHNIGSCRWNNEPSYPEKWFMAVIENEFEDKNYIREYPFNKYSIDFAWPEKKVAVEIDGEQHYRNTEEGLKQHLRDLDKDKLLSACGWKEVRAPWAEIFANPKDWIKKIKILVDN